MLDLQLGEHIVWQGKPFYRKWGGLFVVFVIADFLAIHFLVPSIPITSDQLNGVILIFGLLVLEWLYIYSKYAGVTYYITDRRVVRRQEIPLFKRTQEIGFRSLVRIIAKRRLRRGHVIFQSQDTSILTFDSLDQDPNQIRMIVENGLETGRQSILKEF